MQRLITGRITLYFHNEPRAKKKVSAGRSWPAGRSLDTPDLRHAEPNEHKFFPTLNHFSKFEIWIRLTFLWPRKLPQLSYDGLLQGHCEKFRTLSSALVLDPPNRASSSMLLWLFQKLLSHCFYCHPSLQTSALIYSFLR